MHNQNIPHFHFQSHSRCFHSLHLNVNMKCLTFFVGDKIKEFNFVRNVKQNCRNDCRLHVVTKVSTVTVYCFYCFTIHHLVTSMFHYNGAVNGGSSPHFTSSHPNTLWQLLPWLDMGMLINCSTLQKLYEYYLVNQSKTVSTAPVCDCVSAVQHLVCGAAEASWEERRLSLCPCPASLNVPPPAGVGHSLQMSPEEGVRRGALGRKEELPG